MKKCGHSFCSLCIRRALQFEAKCPVCRERASDFTKDVALESRALNLKLARSSSYNLASQAVAARRDPLPKPKGLLYKALKDKQLRKHLQDYGLTEYGSRNQMVWRHREFTTMLRAAADSSEPITATELREQLQIAERERFSTQSRAVRVDRVPERVAAPAERGPDPTPPMRITTEMDRRFKELAKIAWKRKRALQRKRAKTAKSTNASGSAKRSGSPAPQPAKRQCMASKPVSGRAALPTGAATAPPKQAASLGGCATSATIASVAATAAVSTAVTGLPLLASAPLRPAPLAAAPNPGNCALTNSVFGCEGGDSLKPILAQLSPRSAIAVQASNPAPRTPEALVFASPPRIARTTGSGDLAHYDSPASTSTPHTSPSHSGDSQRGQSAPNHRIPAASVDPAASPDPAPATGCSSHQHHRTGMASAGACIRAPNHAIESPIASAAADPTSPPRSAATSTSGVSLRSAGHAEADISWNCVNCTFSNKPACPSLFSRATKRVCEVCQSEQLVQ